MEQFKAIALLKAFQTHLGASKESLANFEDDLQTWDQIDEAITELEAPKSCKWSMDDPEWGTYKTECGQFFNVTGGDLKDNSFKYCTYCGGVIDEPKDAL